MDNVQLWNSFVTFNFILGRADMGFDNCPSFPLKDTTSTMFWNNSFLWERNMVNIYCHWLKAWKTVWGWGTQKERRQTEEKTKEGGSSDTMAGAAGAFWGRGLWRSETEDKYIIVKETMGQIPQLEKRYIEWNNDLRTKNKISEAQIISVVYLIILVNMNKIRLIQYMFWFHHLLNPFYFSLLFQAIVVS